MAAITRDAGPPAGNEIRWGVVGAGVIAGHFASDLAFASRAVLAGVASRSSATASDFAARHGGKAYADLAAMLADQAIDAVYIASPNETHFAAAMAAIAAGKAVLVEKPLATSAMEAEQIAASAAARGVFAMEAMWTRFLPALAFVRETIRSGAIGRIRRVRGELAFHQPYYAGSRFFDPARGGGALLDLGVYGISLCLALFGEPDAVDGGWKAAPSGVDLSATADMRFGEIHAAVACALDRTGANLFVIEGSEATLVLQPPFNAVRMVVAGKPGPALRLAAASGMSAPARIARKLARTLPLPGLQRRPFAFAGHGLQFEIDAVGEALAAGAIEHRLAPLADSIATLRIIDGLRAKPPAG